jgi:hypothetical protein
VRAVLVEDEARSGCRLYEEFGRVEAVATPANGEGRCGDLAEPSSYIEGILGPDGRDHV